LNPTYSEFKIQTPESEITAKGIAVLLLNFAKINQDISITHRNNARDGFFEVAILKSHNALALLPTLFAAFLDRSDNSPNRPDALEIHMASSVRIESNPPLYLQHDGEVPDAQTPFSASVLPGAVRLIVSPEAYEKFQVV
jgi:diacylglycerol kinase family enzyme